MKKSDFNNKIRDYCRQNLSPSASQQDLITKIYNEINEVLGVNNCIQIGSYARFTAINPVHDLDVLYILGEWNSEEHDPTSALRELCSLIKEDYKNPTEFELTVSLQKHSVNLAFGDEFSVDIVPSYVYGENNFGQDMYKIPEILKEKHHIERKNMPWDFLNEKQWVNSDPRGYSELATRVGENPDFRKAVKFVKKWRANLKDDDPKLTLRSFHLEQVIVKYFLDNPEFEIFDCVFKFFYELKDLLFMGPQIRDRANADTFIDDYLSELTNSQKNKIIAARDKFLIILEEFEDEQSIEDLFQIEYRYRLDQDEIYLFDYKIPTLLEDTITIYGWIQKDGRDARLLNASGAIDTDYNIRFCLGMGVTGSVYKWKVKNDDNAQQKRGEITDNGTLNRIERTAYIGNHYVECYAVQSNVCIAKARQRVIILK